MNCFTDFCTLHKVLMLGESVESFLPEAQESLTRTCMRVATHQISLNQALNLEGYHPEDWSTKEKNDIVNQLCKDYQEFNSGKVEVMDYNI